jgi:DNA-binding NtrC family response regulator
MPVRTGRILIADEDVGALAAARALLRQHCAVVETVTDPADLSERLRDGFEGAGFDVVLLDTSFADGVDSGDESLEWLPRIFELEPRVIVVLLTGAAGVATAASGIEYGATDFVLKPWRDEKLVATVGAAVNLRRSRDEVAWLRTRERELVAAASGCVGDVICAAPAMGPIFDLVHRAALTDANVLITGESGVGKKMIARLLHGQSRRAREVFLSVDLGVASRAPFETELFGHRKDGVTDASEDRPGRFRAAAGGTLFLDEIGNLPLSLQGRLLSALEERAAPPLGRERSAANDVRLVCATSKPLAQSAGTGSFRDDLLYRINTVEIAVPSLRERIEDIGPLFEHFVAFYAHKYGLPRKRLSRGALKRLKAYAWPGNVRELRHTVERALIMSHAATLEARDFLLAPELPPSNPALKLDDYRLETVENRVIQAALDKHGGNVSRTARELGITRASLYRRMEKYGL